MHPFKLFCRVPNPSSRVSPQITEAELEAALERHLTRVSDRNKALTPTDIYERVVADVEMNRRW